MIQYFEVVEWKNDEFRIFQTVGSSKIKIRFYWSKTLSPNTGSDNHRLKFSASKKSIWIEKDGNYYDVDNNKKVSQLWPKEIQSEIKEWLKTNNIKIQRANDVEIERLANYLSEL